jgi:hypothetical protein
MHKALGCFALCALALSWSAPAIAQDTLSGEMARSAYLVGTWDCAVNETMMNKQENGTITWAIAPGNALSQTIVTPSFSSLGYIGYNAQTGKFFENTVTNMGGFSTQAADRGTPGHTIFTGMASQNGQTAPNRDTDDRISDTKIHAVSEVNIGGKWTKVAEVTCNKR